MRIRKLRCSFCRKREDQISKLVAGPRLIVGPKLYICNECVAVASSIMQGNPLSTQAGSPSLLVQEVEVHGAGDPWLRRAWLGIDQGRAAQYGQLIREFLRTIARSARQILAFGESCEVVDLFTFDEQQRLLSAG